MKKIKFLLITVVCAICLCFSFAGCVSGGGAYVKNSFTVDDLSYSSYSERLYFDYSFKVNLYQAGEYTVEYDLYQMSGEGDVIVRVPCKKTLTRSAETDKTEYTISGSEGITTSNSSTRIKIANIKVTLVKAKKSSVPYAIGFGTAGGLLLCVLVVVFILDKLGILKLK